MLTRARQAVETIDRYLRLERSEAPGFIGTHVHLLEGGQAIERELPEQTIQLAGEQPTLGTGPQPETIEDARSGRTRQRQEQDSDDAFHDQGFARNGPTVCSQN